MPVRSPYPDVEIPDVSLTAFLFGDFGDRADAPAFVDGEIFLRTASHLYCITK